MICDKICYFPKGVTLDRELAARTPVKPIAPAVVPPAERPSVDPSLRLGSCNPKGDAPQLCTPARPPQETSAGQAVINGSPWGGLSNIKKMSDGWQTNILNLMDGSVRSELQKDPAMAFMHNMSKQDMLNLLEWEFFYLPLLHNAPLLGNVGGDDSDVFVSARSAPSICLTSLLPCRPILRMATSRAPNTVGP